MFVIAFMATAVFSLLVLSWSHAGDTTPGRDSDVVAGGLPQRRQEDPFMENRVTRASIFMLAFVLCDAAIVAVTETF